MPGKLPFLTEAVPVKKDQIRSVWDPQRSNTQITAAIFFPLLHPLITHFIKIYPPFFSNSLQNCASLCTFVHDCASHIRSSARAKFPLLEVARGPCLTEVVRCHLPRGVAFISLFMVNTPPALPFSMHFILRTDQSFVLCPPFSVFLKIRS